MYRIVELNTAGRYCMRRIRLERIPGGDRNSDFGFLVMIGYNIMPLVLFGGLAVVCYMFLNMQGSTPLQSSGLQNSKALKEVSFDDIGGQDSAINELGEALEFLRSLI